MTVRRAVEVAALAVGGVAAGITLEREVVRRRLPAPVAADVDLAVETPDGVRLHVEVDEPDPQHADVSAPTLVFVHGYTLSLDCWRFQRRHFRGRYRMILYDQRSHGRSGRSAPERCRIPQLGADLAQVLGEVAGPGPLILIGHSMGGMTILELARQHPEWFGDPDGANHSGGGGSVGRILGVGLICSSADGWIDPHGLAGQVASRAVDPVRAVLDRVPTMISEARLSGFSVAPLAVAADFFPAFLDVDQIDVLPVIDRVATAVVGARQDRVLPIRHTEVILEHLPNAARLIVDHSGHLAMVEHHEEVDELLDDLVGRADTPRTCG